MSVGCVVQLKMLVLAAVFFVPKGTTQNAIFSEVGIVVNDEEFVSYTFYF